MSCVRAKINNQYRFIYKYTKNLINNRNACRSIISQLYAVVRSRCYTYKENNNIICHGKTIRNDTRDRNARDLHCIPHRRVGRGRRVRIILRRVENITFRQILVNVINMFSFSGFDIVIIQNATSNLYMCVCVLNIYIYI